MCILTPYKAQRALLNSLLADPLEVLGIQGMKLASRNEAMSFLAGRRARPGRGRPDGAGPSGRPTDGYVQARVYVRLAVVDSMQGATEDIVILSLTRDGFGSPGFLASWARINVATTRSCGLLIILGHCKLLHRCAPCRAILRYCQMAGRYLQLQNPNPGTC